MFGTMDHVEIESITPWPFLLSSHILTNFNLVQLSQSVHAYRDPLFQPVYAITRMSTRLLLADPCLETKFKGLISDQFQFFHSWDQVPANVIMIMYA